MDLAVEDPHDLMRAVNLAAGRCGMAAKALENLVGAAKATVLGVKGSGHEDTSN